MEAKEALAFDDVLLVPAESHILPSQVNVRTRLTNSIELGIPLVSAAMDTVTEHALAIAMAQAGGIGVIHKNMDIDAQIEEVRKVKRFEAGMVVNPVVIHPKQPLSEALALMVSYHISGIPVIERNGKLVGILTNRDLRFATNMDQPVSEFMTKEALVTVREGVGRDEARRLFHQHRIEKLIVVDDEYRCIGLITVKDMEKALSYPNACKDECGRLRVSAAVGVGQEGLTRAEALLNAGADVVVVDTAHGHAQRVIQAVRDIKALANSDADAQVIAGNIATAAGAEALITAGVDAVKVGIGPGSICTTRVVAGVGVPQFTAVMEVAEVARCHGIPVIADGGIKSSGDLAKAIAAGGDSVMIGSLFAGTQEAPGEVFLYQGRSYKVYRGMGSLGAMARGSADRYFQADVSHSLKLVPEGIEGRVPFKGPVAAVIHQLVGGLKSAMGYTGNSVIADLHKHANFRRVTAAGLRESHVHDVAITREAPNYRPENF
ncbi:Inosine-5'-monophosphate dehydrogenase [invertebrate metagenome]|uniref:Inosine-5'-monophosphate dehydrogenase n=1 Tax=invertebrate metagenome TaxID=1711999 RepID=A0A484H4P4_9ZZZZ